MQNKTLFFWIIKIYKSSFNYLKMFFFTFCEDNIIMHHLFIKYKHLYLKKIKY